MSALCDAGYKHPQGLEGLNFRSFELIPATQGNSASVRPPPGTPSFSAPNSPFDQYQRGDKTALSDDAVAGMHEFEHLGCNRCHTGPAFAGPADMPTGNAFIEWFPAFASRYDQEFHLKDDLGINEL